MCFTSIAGAQNGCDQNVKQAEELYNSGDYDNCIQILEKSINECNFSNKKKEAALELLAKSYLDQDKLVQADAAVQNLLANNPNYELKEINSHEDFDILVKKFDTHPLFSVGIGNAAMQPKLTISKTYSILLNVDYNAPYNISKNPLIYYAWAEYEFKKNISVNAEVFNFNIHYDRSFPKNTGWKMNYSENLSFIEVPLYVKKYFWAGKNILPYATFGVGYLKILKAEANSDITYNNEDPFTGIGSNYFSSDIFDMLEMRNKNNFEWLAGCGIGFKLKNIGIFLDAKYCRGLNSITNSANRFNSKVLTNDYFYIDNSIKLNKYQIGISLSYTLKNSIRKVR